MKNNNFISSEDDNNEERVMRSKSDNIEIMISHDADEVVWCRLSLKNTF